MERRFAAADYQGYLKTLAETEVFYRFGRQVDAADIVQETLLRAHRACNQYRGKTEGEYRGWLREILTNVIGMWARRLSAQKRDRTLERSIHEELNKSNYRLEQVLMDLNHTPRSAAIRNEAFDRLRTALECLPTEQRQVIQLRFLRGMGVSDVAKMTGRTEPSVAGLVRRGIARLRELLQEGETSNERRAKS